MNSVNFKSLHNQFEVDGTVDYKPSNHTVQTPSYIKQKLHDKRVDEFFHTDFSAPKHRTSISAMIGSVVGVFAPLLIMAKKRNPNIKLSTFKGFKEAINVHYGLKEILATGLGGVAGGLTGGLLDKKEHNKLDKIEEGVFQTMNVSFPAILVNEGMKLSKKVKFLNNIPAKIAIAAGGILAGASAAVGITNKLDDKFFDKYNKDPERKFRKKDLIVHIDDVFGTFVLAKFPFADKLHVEKILPVIFAWSGYHVGES